ncbi:DUF2474 family protein [Phenylobacterium aquaticum]|nr:DUF2474 family protein [Phenylobacterium aquaticum]
MTPSPTSATWRRWAWFAGLWAASVLALSVVAGVLKLIFGAILK